MSEMTKAAREIMHDPERNRPVEHNMKFRVVRMTPQWAAELLANNHPNNRTKKWRRIEQFQRDMKQGFWKLTHQGIAVDEDGYLVDGQNRLQAVVDSECSVPMVLITGVPRKAMVAADYVSTRSVADSAKILGKGFDKNETAWGSTARRMMIGLKYNLGGLTKTHQEIIAFIQQHREALEFSFEVLSHNKRGLCGAELRAVIARAWYKRNSRSRIRLFCQYLMDGMVDNIKTDSAVIKLRNWLMDMQARGQKGGAAMRDITYAKIEEALVLFLTGEPCERLGQVKAEQFPLETDENEPA